MADGAGTAFTALAGSKGTFRARVPTGSYTVTGRSPLYLSGTSDCAIAPPPTITVTAGGTTRVTVDCQEK